MTISGPAADVRCVSPSKIGAATLIHVAFGAPLQNDFIEVFNRGTQNVVVNGWSVQYGSGTGTTWAATNLSGVIPAGRYYLVQEAAGNSCSGLPCGVVLPTPDATGALR